MTRDPETTLAALLNECLHVRQTVSMSHADRPFRAVPSATLDTVRRELDLVVSILNGERIWRVRESLSAVEAAVDE